MKEKLASVTRSIRRKMASSKVLLSLPAVSNMERVFEHGRCLYDGYQRGAPIRYGTLGDDVQRDPVFRKAFKASRLPAVYSMVPLPRLINLFLLIKIFLRDLASQNIIEFGAFKGGSAIFMATLLKEYYPWARILSLDTFDGLPASRAGVDSPPGDYLEANLHRARETAHSLGLDNLEFLPGLIEETGPEACRRLAPFGLAHIDVVLFEPTLFAQNLALESVTPGGYIVPDDALEPTCPGATLALEDMIRTRGLSMEQTWPQVVFRAPIPASKAI